MRLVKKSSYETSLFDAKQTTFDTTEGAIGDHLMFEMIASKEIISCHSYSVLFSSDYFIMDDASVIMEDSSMIPYSLAEEGDSSSETSTDKDSKTRTFPKSGFWIEVCWKDISFPQRSPRPEYLSILSCWRILLRYLSDDLSIHALGERRRC